MSDVPNNRFPFITCYARILDRITLNPLTEFVDALDKTKVWDLGVIYKLGGYSQYIIEFDIWNNEPTVSGGITQRYFVIEHYFSDDILREHNMINEPILNGIDIFQIQGDKNTFSENVNNFEPEVFNNFNLLFDYMLMLFAERVEE